jgi:hypothetical protein
MLYSMFCCCTPVCTWLKSPLVPRHSSKSASCTATAPPLPQSTGAPSMKKLPPSACFHSCRFHIFRARSNTTKTIARDSRTSRIARPPITSATSIKTSLFFAIFLDISLLLAPEHTQHPRLLYVHDLRTMSHFSRLDPPLRYLANLIFLMCSSLPPVSSPCATYRLRPLFLTCTL